MPHTPPPAVSCEKQAQLTDAERAQLLRDAWTRVAGLSAAGLGAGAGARALLGLNELFKKPPSVDIGSSVTTSIPIGVQQPAPAEEDDHSLARAGRRLKAAMEKTALTEPRQGLNWWQVPAAFFGVGGGVGLGWAGVDKLLAARREALEQAELQDAQAEFEAAIRGAAQAKYAALDSAFEVCVPTEKTARLSAGNALHGSVGAVATLMAMLAMGSGVGTYKFVKSRSPGVALRKAVEQRRRARQQAQPLYAYPAPLPPEKKPRDPATSRELV